ncbi:MAG: hypothetical protein QMD36_01235 [Candidatus Aenigmarchaeota archaeon]|nr:hypothetical protein [Candidatus Aenigmarchaeota archaeon]
MPGVEGLEQRMYAFQDMIKGEIEKKATAGRKLGEYQRVDATLQDLADPATMFLVAYRALLEKAKALKKAIEEEIKKKDPKTYVAVLEQMKVYNEFVNTYIEPARSYVSAIYKTGVVKPFEDAMKDTDELLNTKQAFINEIKEAEKEVKKDPQ